MNIDKRLKLKSIMQHFGITEQLKKLQEELGELSVEAGRLVDVLEKSSPRADGKMILDKNNIGIIAFDEKFLSEMADVEVMIGQIKALAEDISDKVEGVAQYKIERTLMAYKIPITRKYYDDF